jgi:hypothetical protein
VAFAFGPLAVVERLGRRAAQGRERDEEHGVLESAVAAAAAGFGGQAGAGLAGDRAQAGVGGELAAVAKAERSPVSARIRAPVPGPIPGMLASSSPKRVRQEHLLDLAGQGVPAGRRPGTAHQPVPRSPAH